jgi:hypothetical protein
MQLLTAERTKDLNSGRQIAERDDQLRTVSGHEITEPN